MSHQHGWIAIGRTRRVDRDRAIVTLQSPDDRSDGVEGFWKNSMIAARSSRDRGVGMVESPPIEQTSIDK